MNILLAILFVLFPSAVIFACSKIKVLGKIGVVLLCYICGMIVGNIGILPEGFSIVQSNMQDISVCLALPLLLFSMDVKGWLKAAGKGITSFALATVAIVVVVVLLHVTVGRNDEESWQLAGMAAGVYTGGTPNLASIKTALLVSNDTFILFHTYDTVISLLYIVFMCTLARSFFLKLFKMKAYEPMGLTDQGDASDISDESLNAYRKMLKPDILKRLVPVFLLAAVILGVSYLAGTLFPEYATMITILLLTTFGIACSFIKPVRNTKNTFQLGMYIIYVFCFTVATMADLSALVHMDWTIFLYVIISIIGSMLLHALLCKLFKIDADTFIITSVSAICSPPFVPPVAAALKNKEILITGLITGIIGYAIGNYLGIGISMLLQNIH